MTKVQRRIQEAYAACYRLCEAGTRQSTEWLEKSLDAARRGETGHRAMDARFLQKPASRMYKLPVADAARFFAVKWFLDYAKAPESYADACALREDCLYGYGARDSLAGEELVERWALLRNEYADVIGLDYSEVFAA